MNKKNVLLTSMGGKSAYEFVSSFDNVEDLELFICDINENSISKNLTKNFFTVLPGNDKNYCADLLLKMKKFKIDMVIPGSDEEAFAIMEHKSLFENEGIITAIQDSKNFKYLESKTSMYDYLRHFDIKLPKYKKITDKNSLIKSCIDFDIENKLLLIKPVQERGGRGIYVLSKTESQLNENLLNLTLEKFIENHYDEQRDYVLMEYIEGIVYDIDVLRYKNGDVYFGSRKRFTNITKDFTGNIFDFDERIIDYSKKIYECLPSDYLLDYDLIVTKKHEIYLLEVNPRPSGSLISYLAYDINLYEILFRSYLFGNNKSIPNLDSKKALIFNKIVKA